MVLAVRERGAGRPIVLLPWFGLDGGVTELAFEPAFAEPTGWRRIYIDLPGTGRSAAVAPNSDAVLDAVRDTVASLPRYLLAGCSYGGYLAAGLARRDPERVEGLLLVCAGVKIRPADRNLTRVVPSSPQPHWLDDVPEPLREHFAHGVGRQSRSVAERVRHAFTVNGPSEDDYLGLLRSTGYRLSDEDALAVYRGPATLVAGRRDRIAGYLDTFDALDRYPNASYHALDDAGHYLPFEQPETFVDLVRDWLTRSTRSRPAG
ncbi:MAG TPA: alpha/beta hydrolase [Jatrophihabitantaceae bacterium]|nr:alpha/beta hydrolase [Jatrophihabitantaceae bacterium]